MKFKNIAAKMNKLGVVFVLVVVFILFSFIAPNFLRVRNIFNVARQICTLGICSVGMSMVLICGGIDLSVGYQISLINVLCAYMMVNMDMNPVLAVILCIALGTFMGFMNGVIIVKSGVMPMIVTLAILNVYNGFSYMISKGIPIFGFPAGFSYLGQGNLFNTIPVSLVIMAAIFVAGEFFLRKIYIGRYFYAIGSNEEAAKLSGINTGRIRITAHTMCGFLTAIAAILMLSRTNSGLSNNGAGFEFNVITACVLGGVSAQGGKGTVLGALTGVLIIGFLENGLLLMNVSEYTQLVIKGLLLLGAVAYDTAMIRKGEQVKKLKEINPENEL